VAKNLVVRNNMWWPKTWWFATICGGQKLGGSQQYVVAKNLVAYIDIQNPLTLFPKIYFM